MNGVKYVLFFLLIAFVSSAQYPVTKQHLRSYSPTDFRIHLLNADNEKVREAYNNPLTLEKGFKSGQKLQVSGSNYFEISIGDKLPKSLIYLPKASGHFYISGKKDKQNVTPEFEGTDIKVELNKVETKHFFEYRNLAINP